MAFELRWDRPGDPPFPLAFRYGCGRPPQLRHLETPIGLSDPHRWLHLVPGALPRQATHLLSPPRYEGSEVPDGGSRR
jgi:hypothetical protein